MIIVSHALNTDTAHLVAGSDILMEKIIDLSLFEYFKICDRASGVRSRGHLLRSEHEMQQHLRGTENDSVQCRRGKVYLTILRVRDHREE